MIRTGSIAGTIEYNPERTARITKAFKQELGSAGIAPAMREADAAGDPSDVDAEDNHVVKVGKEAN